VIAAASAPPGLLASPAAQLLIVLDATIVNVAGFAVPNLKFSEVSAGGRQATNRTSGDHLKMIIDDKVGE
jgi:hypothetical protein